MPQTVERHGPVKQEEKQFGQPIYAAVRCMDKYQVAFEFQRLVRCKISGDFPGFRPQLFGMRQNLRYAIMDFHSTRSPLSILRL